MTEAIGHFTNEEEAGSALRSMIGDSSVAPQDIADLLDGLDGEMRAPVIRQLGRKEQLVLYDKVAGFAELELVDLVPPGRSDLEEVRHLGKNTLPLFTLFEKRFCRLAGEQPEAPKTLAGYNFQTFGPITGPGYFMAVEDANTREVLVDYSQLPTQTPSAWPAVRSNEQGLSRFVYGFMIDRLRRVSEHVTIGSAARNGRDLGSYFVLCRDD